jgi:hypothetical protein
MRCVRERVSVSEADLSDRRALQRELRDVQNVRRDLKNVPKDQKVKETASKKVLISIANELDFWPALQ